MSKTIAQYHRVKGPRKMKSPLPDQEAVENEARRCYGERARIESFTDEVHVFVHVFVLRRDNKRRDFVASYQAEGL